nr:uncharacterized protein LOC123747344 [Procambarus clarkii]XP_045585459.1 uncharacterized protein LOC123747344 [Procambarus clarkii]
MAVGITCWTVFVLLGVSQNCFAEEANFAYQLRHFLGVRHPEAPSNKPLTEARDYIKEQFKQYGLDLEINQFTTDIYTNSQKNSVAGENIVGVARGHAGGPVLLVGADYDSNLEQSPLENNGAGVAAMLEVAGSYMAATRQQYRRASTVLFVAFDLNTKEYENTRVRYGPPGSYHFLHQWLWPFINQSVDNFAGAIILDSITRFSTENSSQHLPRGFETAFREANQEIRTRGKKGDFLALFSTGSSAAQHLARTIIANYNEDPKASKLRLQELRVLTNRSVGDSLHMFNHQAQFHFWTFQPSDEPMSLPAVLLTDTDVYRKSGEVCEEDCSVEVFLTQTRQDALGLVSTTLTNALLQLQTAGGGSTGLTVAPAFVVSTLVASILVLFNW